jgi:hypothetical protein
VTTQGQQNGQTRRPTPPAHASRRSGDEGGTSPAEKLAQHARGPADDRSLFAAGRGLQQYPGGFEAHAKALEDDAASMEDNTPMTHAVIEQMRAAAAVLRGMAADSAEWHSAYQRHHEHDIARTETPRRGSLAAERAADVTAYERDS